MDKLLKAALETFPNFILVDNKGIIVYINEQYAKLHGTTQNQAIGKPVRSVISNTRIHIVLRTGKEEIGSIMTLFDHTQGKEISVVCNRIPIFEDGKIIGVIAATTLSNIFDVEKLHQEVIAVKKQNEKYAKRLIQLQKNLNPLEKIIGSSKSICEVKKSIKDYADSNLSVLITGETGVGKEVFAKAIHQSSNRSLNNFVKINCAAIPANLLESELFGYAEGAFTGAVKGGKMGRIELADKGTLLLDEIGEMPLDLQVKLLRVLQEKEFERVGSVDTIKVNVRLISCTNQNIEKMIEEGRFREDLYYRINVVELNILPLRFRLDDIEPLCLHFIKEINQENNYDIKKIDNRVINLFKTYKWPGNVRELQHTIERAAVICKSGTLELEHVSFIKNKIIKLNKVEDSKEITLRGQKQKTEKDAIIQALIQTGGNKTKAAALLNIDRSRLYSKIKKYNIDA